MDLNLAVKRWGRTYHVWAGRISPKYLTRSRNIQIRFCKKFALDVHTCRVPWKGFRIVFSVRFHQSWGNWNTVQLLVFLRNSASSFYWLSSSIFNVCSSSSFVPHPWHILSFPWCFWPYTPYIFCEDMILATCQCQHIFWCWVEPSLLLSSFD